MTPSFVTLAQQTAEFPSSAIIGILVIVLAIVGSVAFLFSRYKMCPSDKILIVYGNVGAGRSAKCIHGGATFVMPVIQSYAFMDLNPINIDVPLKGALSSQNIRVDVPSSFIVGISTQPEIMQNAASRLLGRSRQDIRDLASEIIMGQMRVVIASLTIEEINADREKLIKGITGGVGGVPLVELLKDVLTHLRRYAAAGVGDRHHGQITFLL